MDVTGKIFSFIENIFCCNFFFFFSERMEEEHKDMAKKKKNREIERTTGKGAKIMDVDRLMLLSEFPLV